MKLQKIYLLILIILVFDTNFVFVNADITASGSLETRGITYISEFTLYSNNIMGDSSKQYSGMLKTTIVAQPFNESFNLVLDSIDFKLFNSNKLDVVTSLWLESGKDVFSLQSSYPNFIVSVPIEFSPRLLEDNTDVIIEVTYRGSYSGFLLNGEYFTFVGTMVTFDYESNIKFIADEVFEDPDVSISNSSWIILLSVLIIIAIIIRYLIYRSIKKKSGNNIASENIKF